MPVSEKIVREAIQHLDSGDHGQARTTLESGLGATIHGAWKIVADDGRLLVGHLWLSRRWATHSIKDGFASFLRWQKGYHRKGEELIEAFLESPDGERTQVARIVREEIGDED